MSGIVVLVTGGRDFGEDDRDREDWAAEVDLVFATLDTLHAERPIRVVIHGACQRIGDVSSVRGADGLAQQWALTREVPYIGVPAQWRTRGKGAGPIRNSDLVKRWVECAVYAAIGARHVSPPPVVVMAYPGGRGTADLLSKAGRFEIRRNELPVPSPSFLSPGPE